MKLQHFLRPVLFAAVSSVALALAGCEQDTKPHYQFGEGPKAERPVADETAAKMAALDMDKNAPILIRIYKEDSKFEVWKKTRSGKYAHLKTYDICRWSGKLGPKVVEGDRQAPEGFYTITPGQMNPNSHYFLSFNTGYPNEYDRSLGRTGSNVMVHGACSSAGCYAMSDENIEQIYALARDALQGGQRGFQMQIYPFRMTAQNLARHWDDPNMSFWKMLKEGADHFEVTRLEPKVAVCGRKYVFDATPAGNVSPTADCPALKVPDDISLAVLEKQKADDAQYQVAVADIQKAQREEAAHQLALARVEEKARQEVALAAQKEKDRQEALARLPASPALPSLQSLPILSMFAPKPVTLPDPQSKQVATNLPTAVTDTILQPAPPGARLPLPNPLLVASNVQRPVQVVVTPPVQDKASASNVPEQKNGILDTVASWFRI